MRYLCIHGHFYQPPRENPWLEAVELQDSAYPYHDWNERITAECYAPNAAARILDAERRITNIVNNYSRISFNFGPTLLAWAGKSGPELYTAILDADQQSRERFSGHGSAIAQAYNHMIMPLANRRDKYTQILWGIHDFRAPVRPRARKGCGSPRRRWTRDARHPGGTRDPVHHPCAAPGASACSTVGRRNGWTSTAGGSTRRVPIAAAAVGPLDRGLLLRRPDLAGGRFRRAAEQRRELRRAADERVFADSRDWAAAGPHRHRRRDLRPSSSATATWRWPTRCITSKQTTLARLTNYGEFLGTAPADARGRDLREHCLELRPRRRALEERLRLQLRRAARLEPGSGAAPLRAALDWLRDTLAPLYEQRMPDVLSRTRGSARRLHRRGPRPVTREPLGASCATTRRGS